MAESPKPPSNLTDSSATGGLENKGASTAQYGAMVKDGSKIAGDANDALDENKSQEEREQSKEELKQGIAENGPAFGGAAVGAVATKSPEGAAVGYGIGKEVGKATAPVTRQVIDPAVDVAVDKGSEIKGKLKDAGVPTDEATKATRSATQGGQQLGGAVEGVGNLQQGKFETPTATPSGQEQKDASTPSPIDSAKPATSSDDEKGPTASMTDSIKPTMPDATEEQKDLSAASSLSPTDSIKPAMPGAIEEQKDLSAAASSPTDSIKPAMPGATEEKNDLSAVSSPTDNLTKGGTDLASDGNQSANPEAAVASGAKDVVGVGANVETATNSRVSEQERHDATRDAARGGAKVGTAAAVTVAYNVAADGETAGVGAGASANVYGATNAVNEQVGNAANAMGVNKMQQQMGLGDGTAYTSGTDIVADAGTQVAGKQISDAGTQARGGVGEEYHEEIQLGAEGTKAGLSAASGEAPDNIDKISQRSGEVGQKHGVMDEDDAKNLNAAGQTLQSSVNLSKMDPASSADNNATEILGMDQVGDVSKSTPGLNQSTPNSMDDIKSFGMESPTNAMPGAKGPEKPDIASATPNPTQQVGDMSQSMPNPMDDIKSSGMESPTNAMPGAKGPEKPDIASAIPNPTQQVGGMSQSMPNPMEDIKSSDMESPTNAMPSAQGPEAANPIQNMKPEMPGEGLAQPDIASKASNPMDQIGGASKSIPMEPPTNAMPGGKGPESVSPMEDMKPEVPGMDKMGADIKPEVPGMDKMGADIKPEVPGMDKMGGGMPKLDGGGDGPEAAVGGVGAKMTDAMKSSGKDQIGAPTESDIGPAEGMSKGLSMPGGKGPESQVGNGLELISKELSGLANKVNQMDAQQLVQELDKLLNTAQALTTNTGLSNGKEADNGKENKSSMPSTRFGGDEQKQESGPAMTNALSTKMSPIENISNKNEMMDMDLGNNIKPKGMEPPKPESKPADPDERKSGMRNR